MSYEHYTTLYFTHCKGAAEHRYTVHKDAMTLAALLMLSEEQ